MDISGKDIKDLHPENIWLILSIIRVPHIDISGKEINDEHPLNIEFKSEILDTFHFDISGKEINDEHPLNIKISYMFDECESLISLPDISKWNN